jgi:hypothetical protein
MSGRRQALEVGSTRNKMNGYVAWERRETSTKF